MCDSWRTYSASMAALSSSSEPAMRSVIANMMGCLLVGVEIRRSRQARPCDDLMGTDLRNLAPVTFACIRHAFAHCRQRRKNQANAVINVNTANPALAQHCTTRRNGI